MMDLAALRKSLKKKDGLRVAKLFRAAGGVETRDLDRSWFETAVVGKWRSDVSFDEFKKAVDGLVEVLKEEDGFWLAPVVGVFAMRLRKLARLEHSKLQVTKELLDSIFRYTVAFGKKGASQEHLQQNDLPLILVVELMKIYALLNSDSMTRNLIGTVEHSTFPEMSSFSTPRRVSYAFYAGRYYVLEGDAQAALRHLQFALDALGKKRHAANRRRILEYLIPVKISLGYQPTRAQLAEISEVCPAFGQIVRAIASGNVKKMSEILDNNQSKFCRLGVYTMLSKSRMLALRNLVRLCVHLHREQVEQTEKNKFPLSKLYPAMRKWDDFVPLDEEDLIDHTKCVIVNLISSRLIKGYLSFEREIMVVSANDAFPKASVVLNP